MSYSGFAWAEADKTPARDGSVTLSASQVKMLRSLKPLLSKCASLMNQPGRRTEETSTPWTEPGEAPGLPSPPASQIEHSPIDTKDLLNLLDATLDMCLAPASSKSEPAEQSTPIARLLQMLEKKETTEQLHVTRDSPIIAAEEAPVLRELSAIERFPPEVLGSVLKWAAWLCTQEAAYLPSREIANSWGPVPGKDVAMSTVAAQRWLLSLSTVCKKWHEVVPQVAWNNVYLHDKIAFDKVTQLIKRKPALADLITDKVRISLEMPISLDKSKKVTTATTTGNMGGNWGGAGNNNVAWGGGGNEGGGWGAGAGAGWGDPADGDPSTAWTVPEPRKTAMMSDGVLKCGSPEEMIIEFLNLAKKVRRLRVDTDGQLDSGISRSSRRISFMQRDLLKALNTPTLTSLELDCLILFVDLEQLLLATSSLHALRITGGVDNADRVDAVTQRNHENCFRQFAILSKKERGVIQERQMEWLLRPAVGHLLDLEMVLPSHLIAANWNNGGASLEDQPFASTRFDELLVSLAPTLYTLQVSVVKPPASTRFNWTGIEPHNGNYGFALSHCRRLETISLPWHLAGGDFIEALAQCPKLETMDMSGCSISVRSRDLCSAIQDGVFQNLQKIWFRAFRIIPGVTTWSTKDLRALTEVCEERDISFEYNI